MTYTLDRTKIDEIQDETAKLSLARIAEFLQDHLGQKFTAYVAGLADVKMVGAWIKGTPPRSPADLRLRCAYQVVRMISEAYDDDTAKAWLFGTNTRLKDEAPAYLLRHARLPDDLRAIVPVARAFAGAAE